MVVGVLAILASFFITMPFTPRRHLALARKRRTVGEDRRLDAERTAIREREARLAARRAAEAGDGPPGP